jgi:hypothetical protein
MRTSLPPLVCFLVLCGSSPAQAARITDLASAFDEGDPYDFNILVGYDRELRRGLIRREREGSQAETLFTKELRYTQERHLLNVRADFAVYKDLQIHFQLPIVLSDRRYWNFAQNGGDPCMDGNVNLCVTPQNSTLTRDGFVTYDPTKPPGETMVPNQVQVGVVDSDTALNPPAAPGGLGLPKRSGLDQLFIGVQWAPISQARDYTKPTWVLGFEARIAVGPHMTYNPRYNPNLPESDLNPKGNGAVGRGLHQFHFWLAFSKRFKYLDPYMTLFYMLPLAKSNSLFGKSSFPNSGQERHAPQHIGGATAGMEIIPWEDTEKGYKLSIDVATRLTGVFEGRGYSDIWELFANSPQLVGNCYADTPTGSADGSVDETPLWNNGVYCPDPNSTIPYPGITSIENHAVVIGWLAFNLDLTQWVRVRTGVSFGHEQAHFITFGDAGKEKNNVSGLQRVESEVNPMFRPYIDNVGRRFRTAQSTVFDVFVSLQGRF